MTRIARRLARPRGLLLALALAGVLGTGASLAILSDVPASVVVSTRPETTLGFEPAATVVATDGSISVTLRNRSSQAHNLVFTDPDLGATRTIVEAGSSASFVLAPVGPGIYPFVCTIHEGMRGTLEIVAPSPATIPG